MRYKQSEVKIKDEPEDDPEIVDAMKRLKLSAQDVAIDGFEDDDSDDSSEENRDKHQSSIPQETPGEERNEIEKNYDRETTAKELENVPPLEKDDNIELGQQSKEELKSNEKVVKSEQKQEQPPKDRKLLQEEIESVEIFDSPPTLVEFEETVKKNQGVAHHIKNLLIWYEKCGLISFSKLVEDDILKVKRDKNGKMIPFEVVIHEEEAAMGEYDIEVTFG